MNYSYSIIIIIPSDLYYFDMIENFYKSIVLKYNLAAIFLVVAYTYDMYKKCLVHNIPVKKIDNLVSEDNTSYKITSPNFIKKTRLKHPILYKYLKLYRTVLFLDADVFFFKNPLVLIRYFKYNADLMMPCDNINCSLLNYGFVLIKQNTKSLSYIRSLINIEKLCKSYKWNDGEQGLANKFLRNVSYITVQKMAINYFMDGYNFFVKYSFGYKYMDNNLIGFHNDFTVGVESKIYRLKELGLYISANNNGKYNNKNFIYYNGTIGRNLQKTINILSYLIYICRISNRTLILPKFECNKNRKCTFIEFFNLECFNKCKINYYENISFFIMNDLF